MSERSQGDGWWLASDGKWYPPESLPASPAYASGAAVGKARSIGLTILLAIVTFGIWTIFWSYWNGEELKRYRPAGMGGTVFVLLHIFVNPAVWFLLADEVGKMYQEAGEEPPITAIWGLWFLLPIIGNFIWYIKIQNAINNFWIARGAAPATGV
jgi:succinate dehydrogenase/fumarate reductase cytochrome b subunit